MKKLLLSVFTLIFATTTNAQSNFITVWTSTTSISNIFFQTLGSSNYTWTAMPSGNTGTGSFPSTFGGVNIALNSPANNTVTLVMSPQIQRLKLFNSPNASELINVQQWGSCAWSMMDFAFAGCVNLNVTATDVPNLSNVFNAQSMFASCNSLTGPSNINNWNVSNITNMSGMFSSCVLFNQNISGWNTANVTKFNNMFDYCLMFNQPIGTWNVTSGTNFEAMFYQAQAFNQDISTWNTSNATNMASMFNGASVFNQPIGSWNISNVTYMNYMFSNASSFNQPLSNWNTNNVTNMTGMFDHAAAFNQPLNSWNTNNVTNMSYMFNDAQLFNQPLNSWNTSNVTDMSLMFLNASAFNQPLSNWDVANVTNFNEMFNFSNSSNPNAFNQNLGAWTLNSAASLLYMFTNSIDCDNYSATLNGWSTNTLTPNGLNLIAQNVTYGTNAVVDRNNLISVKNWTINGDIASGNNCQAITTGIDELSNTVFSVYPNPTSNLLYINSANKIDTIQITDVLGKIVYNENTTNSETTIDLSTLTSGIYFITVGNTTKKIIKEHNFVCKWF